MARDIESINRFLKCLDRLVESGRAKFALYQNAILLRRDDRKWVHGMALYEQQAGSFFSPIQVVWNNFFKLKTQPYCVFDLQAVQNWTLAESKVTMLQQASVDSPYKDDRLRGTLLRVCGVEEIPLEDRVAVAIRRLRLG